MQQHNWRTDTVEGLPQELPRKLQQLLNEAEQTGWEVSSVVPLTATGIMVVSRQSMSAAGKEKVLDVSVKEVHDWEPQLRNLLVRNGYRYIGDLARARPDVLMGLRRFGELSLGKVHSLLAEYGLFFGMTLEDWKRPEDPQPRSRRQAQPAPQAEAA